MKRKDKYDRAIEWLRKHPDKIGHAWDYPETSKAGCLFAYLGETSTWNFSCGCPTQVKSEQSLSAWEEVTARVLKAPIPDAAHDIQVKHLRSFAAIQRYADKFRAKDKKGAKP